MEVETESRQLLPDDLVLEIVVRLATIASVICCAATCKPIRRGILHEPFLRRFLARNNGGHGAHGSFIPSLLLGLYHQAEDPHRPPAFAPAADGASYPASVAALPTAPNHDNAGDDDACHFGPYRPVASRRSLLVLRRRCKIGASPRRNDHLVERHGGIYPVELSVCNPTTGERFVLPPHDVRDDSHVLLDVNPLAPSAFKLLVAQLSLDSPKTLYVQIFSSEDGEWGRAMACPTPRSCEFLETGIPRPVVLGGTVHWLCSTAMGNCILTWRWRGDGGEPVPHATSLAELPEPYMMLQTDMCLAVQPSTTGGDAAGPRALLSLIVLDRGEVRVWVRESTGWECRRRIQETGVARPMDFGNEWLRGAELAWFCEGSGTVFLRPGDGTPLLLDLDGMAVRKLKATSWDLHQEREFCPYEVDLTSYMLFVMKRF
ncbi:hypothetical protein ACP70R_037115 [Stipagrostis hirtigluma subsp. patula]